MGGEQVAQGLRSREFHILQLPFRPQTPAVKRDTRPVAMTRRSTGQIYPRPRDILRPAKSSIGVRLRHCCLSAFLADQARRHLRGEEAGSDAIAENMPGPKVDGQVASEVDHGGWRGR